MGLRVSQIPAEKDKDLLSRVNMDAHACNHSTWEVEAGGSGVKSHSRYIVEGQPFCDPLKTKKKKNHREKRGCPLKEWQIKVPRISTSWPFKSNHTLCLAGGMGTRGKNPTYAYKQLA